ncbi:MAG TPA: LuxR C-terminal-related transcriptional regulator [Archangium sp.]|uniref:helix-turn-helix transcriptional regulator n=1 Tax=Archangium sp. TaxID=1872627 RepID=UPI002E31DC8D|nr:LuxR C-terminal-related transcriptional regulator [Archangium sp.]HEX5752440.1 LuxR C-terminal-related transcriptional regulator [Archangium sp.]
MSRSPQQTFFDLTCALVESRSLAQFQERTEPLLAKLFQADHVAFCRMHPDLPTGFEWRASTTGHFLQSYYQWFRDDFVFRWLSRRPNTAWSDTEMLRGQKVTETETYRRSRASDLNLRHVLAALLAPAQQVGSGAVALYSERNRAFSPEMRRLLQRLTPALSGAFQNFSRFEALSAHSQLLEELLRQEGAHAIVLDGQRREFYRTEAATSVLQRWFPSRSDRDDGGIPRAWRERMDTFMAGSVLVSPTSLAWREARGMSALEVCFTRLPLIEGRERWELRLKEVHAIPEKWRRLLSARLFEVAALIVQGLAYKEIASKLRISENTAKEYVQLVYEKLKVSGRAGLINLARRS